MQRFNHRVTVDTGTAVRWVSAPTVTVYDSGTVSPSTIFDDDALTPKSNPFTGPGSGLIFFYAADGKYDVVFSGGTPAVSYTRAGELLDDTLGLSSSGVGIAVLNAQAAASYPSQTLATGISGIDFNILSAGGAHVFNLPNSSSTVTGKLRSADFNTFSNKISSINALTSTAQLLTIDGNGTTPAWTSTGSTHALSLPLANSVNTGILSATDWTTFNNKQMSLSGGTTVQFLRGDRTWQTLQSDAVTEGSTNLYFTVARARATVSATTPLAYNSGTGTFSIQAGTTAQNGYITSTDWNTFNNKMGTLNTLSDVTQSFSIGSTGNDVAIASAAAVHLFKFPSAGATSRGLVTTGPQTIAGPKTFSSELYLQSYIDLTEIPTQGLAAANRARLYVRDNGSGKTQLVIIYQSGVTKVIDTEV